MSTTAICIVVVLVLALVVVLLLITVVRLVTMGELSAARITDLEAELSETKNLLNQPRKLDLTPKAVDALASGIARAITTPGRN